MHGSIENIIDFPVNALSTAKTTARIEDDPYYRFIRNVLHTADTYGFELPVTIDSAAEHVYQKTRYKSQLAKMFAQAEQD